MERRMLTEDGCEPSTERCARESAFAADGDSSEQTCPDEQQQKAQIQSMRDCIERHYGETLLSELEEKVNSGKIAPRFNRKNGT